MSAPDLDPTDAAEWLDAPRAVQQDSAGLGGHITSFQSAATPWKN